MPEKPEGQRIGGSAVFLPPQHVTKFEPCFGNRNVAVPKSAPSAPSAVKPNFIRAIRGELLRVIRVIRGENSIRGHPRSSAVAREKSLVYPARSCPFDCDSL